MEAGTTVYVPDPGASYDSHLWMIISDPKLEPKKVLIVNFTSWASHKDQACVVDVGDHPYLQHRTCVNYRDAKLVSLDVLYQLKDSGKISTKEPLSEALLKKVRNCVADSRLPLEYADLLAEQGLIEL